MVLNTTGNHYLGSYSLSLIPPVPRLTILYSHILGAQEQDQSLNHCPILVGAGLKRGSHLRNVLLQRFNGRLLVSTVLVCLY